MVMGFPALSRIVGGVQFAVMSMMLGLVTSEGTAKPDGIAEAEVY
jgi:hypothetical protein